MIAFRTAIHSVLPALAVILATTGCGGRTTILKALVPQGLALAMTETGEAFEKANPGVEVEMLFASSGTLAQQAKAGMPADMFFSASDKVMDDMCACGLANPLTRVPIASNVLVLIVPAGVGDAADGPESLSSDRAGRIAIGNPGHVPSGDYAMQTLRSLEMADKLAPKLVLCEHVRQVLALVSSGEADAGFVYGSDAASAPSSVKVVWEANPGLHKPIVFSMAMLADCSNIEAAERFASFVTGPQGRAILERHGFGPAAGVLAK